MELIESRGASCDFHDRFVPVIPRTREHTALAGRQSIPLTPSTIAEYDAVLIATDHDEIDYSAVVQNAKVVVDTRNACERAGIMSDKIIKA